jgi:sorting nexin-4
MAIIDQDNFSNISWQIETNNGVEPAQSSASMPNIDAEPPSSEAQHHGQDLQLQDPGLSGDILECAVSEPHKESDGTKDAFVSYLITTMVRMCV